ncbi:MAG TPA: MmoB/DmpM family protein [Acidimicrobiia bacterium]|jgi:toluene monooxygenase system protein D
MREDSGPHSLGVGPVLQATPLARTIVAVIEDENENVSVRDEGAYLRVLVPRICRLSRAAVEAATGSTVQFPGDLEVIMSSFAGRMRLSEEGAVWWLAGETPPERRS